MNIYRYRKLQSLGDTKRGPFIYLLSKKGVTRIYFDQTITPTPSFHPFLRPINNLKVRRPVAYDVTLLDFVKEYVVKLRKKLRNLCKCPKGVCV